MRERSFINLITDKFLSDSKLLTKGIGDDCAVFGENDNQKWLVSTDLLVEDVHFVLDWHEPYLLGRKSIAVNLSDIAAMGGEPVFVLISLSIPPQLDDRWLNNWMDGVSCILKEHNCQLIGGDTTRGTKLIINVMVLGRGQKNSILYRSSATEPQDIYVSGNLGSSAAGLELLKMGEYAHQPFADLVSAHLNPEPQVKAGLVLAESGVVRAMQDISDGLATDLSHICHQSNTGAVIQKERLPFSASLERFCLKYKYDMYSFMLSGGEDYHLVFTAEPSAREALSLIAEKNRLRFFRIGKIKNDSGTLLVDKHGGEQDITFAGFEHKC